jgi:hypothetical protein
MGQLNESSYLKLNPYYGRSDGVFVEKSTGDIVVAINGTIVGRYTATGGAAELALARGSVFAGNSSGKAAALDAKTSGHILIGDGTDVKSVAVSGDVGITSSGVTSIGAGKVLSAMMAQNLLRYAEATISAADIVDTGVGKFGHANGYPIVAALGTEYAIEFISGVVIYDYATAAYTGGGNVTFNYGSGGSAVSGAVTAANSIGAGGDKVCLLLAAAPTNNSMPVNTGINLVAASAFTQPGTAAGVVRVKCLYRAHTTGL